MVVVPLIPIAIFLLQNTPYAFGMGIWCNTLARLDTIAFGALLALILRRRAVSVGGVAWIFVGAAIVLVSMRFESFVTGRPIFGSLIYSANAIACALMVFGAVTSKGGFLAHPWIVYLGRISYGLYVFHALGILLAWNLRAHFATRGWLLLNIAVPVTAFAITLILAAASYKWLESPFLRMKNRFSTILSSPSA